MTGTAGQVTLQAPGPGTYHVHVHRIGFAEVVSEPLQLAPGPTVRHTIFLPAAVVTLPAVEVQALSQCDDRQRGGTAAAILWENIRTALTATVLTLEDAPYLRVTRFRRDVSLSGVPRQLQVLSQRIMRGDPFQAFSPDDLMAWGFVRQLGDSIEYAGVDATVLLSDEFTRTHCFRAVDGADRLIGLAFEPSTDRVQSDVRGVLWVDRQTIELRRLEFTYTRLPTGPAPLVGGAAGFQRLPSGAWIVGEWFVRMPRVVRSESPGPAGTTTTTRLEGYLDHGGQAILVSASEQAVSVAAGAAGTVVGMVYDSLSRGPLAGAVVSVSGEDDSVVTSEDGSFRLPVASAGQRFLLVRHPRLGILSDGSNRLVTVPAQGEAAVAVAVPPITTFVATLCGAGAGSAGVLGIAWGADGAPQAGLEIGASWPVLRGNTITGSASASGQSTTRGVYALCRLPSERQLNITLKNATRELSSVSIRIAPGEFRWLDLRAPSP